MIAYHVPPMVGSSGIQRTMGFARALPAWGWKPTILTAHARAYESIRSDSRLDIPQEIVIHRAFALDSARHLSIFGHYPLAVALPDRWVSWVIGAVPTGLAIIRSLKPAALWSTYPIASAHLIGYWLARLSGLPWVADFRDPMAHEGYPANRRTWRSFLSVEQRVFEQASICVFATKGAAKLYRMRYPQSDSRIRVIENGYDESDFAAAELSTATRVPDPKPFTLLHSGIVYPEWRDPRYLLQAIRDLIQQGLLDPATFRLRFRSPVHDAFLHEQIAACKLIGTVEVLPALPYRAALEEMLRADALLILQSSDCNDQIPAKFYEYIRAGKPVLALTDATGETARAMRDLGLTRIAPLNSPSAIASGLIELIVGPKRADEHRPAVELVRQMSRFERTCLLADIFSEITNKA